MSRPEEFDPIWNKICSHEGLEFTTATGLTFTYSISGNSLLPSRTKYQIARSDFEKAWELLPSASRSELNSAVRGPSYIVAILKDSRMRP